MKSHYNLKEALAAINQIVELSSEVRSTMQKSVDFLNKYLSEASAPVYGVNTGFGSLQNVVIDSNQLSELQRNLLITHAAGTGDYLKTSIVKKMLWLKLYNMSKGHSGIRPLIFERLAAMLNQKIYPLIPEQGSLGASGDLAPLSHMVLPIIGLGQLHDTLNDKIITGAEWLKRNDFEPVELQAKEALALINGTQFMLAHALEMYEEFLKVDEKIDLICAASWDGFDCRLDPVHEGIHEIRPHKFQQEWARRINALLSESNISKTIKKQVQDPYSFRCVPQVHGASYTALEHCFKVWEVELNSVTDNPNVLEEYNAVLSGGNFHGQPLALTLDYAAMALAELASISERRTYLLISGQRGLPPYLVENAGLDSGYMIAQYTAASIVSQNKQLCTPASVDSIMSSNGQEDHVSMGANSATKLLKVLQNTKNVLAIEWLCAVRSLAFREDKTAPQIEKLKQSFDEKINLNHQNIPMAELIGNSLKFLF